MKVPVKTNPMTAEEWMSTVTNLMFDLDDISDQDARFRWIAFESLMRMDSNPRTDSSYYLCEHVIASLGRLVASYDALNFPNPNQNG